MKLPLDLGAPRSQPDSGVRFCEVTRVSEGASVKGGERGGDRNASQVQGSQTLHAILRNVGYLSHSVTSQTTCTFSVALGASNVA